MSGYFVKILIFKILVLIFTIVLFEADMVFAQQVNLQIVARSLQDSILLRWAPANYQTWKLGNQYGYKLTRYTLFRNDSLLSKSERTELVENSIKPYELGKWETLVKNDKYAAITAQSIYGKGFEIEAGKDMNPQSAYNQSNEQQQRFTFALFAADMSPAVALASGLWFVDKSAQKNEKYLYRLYIDLPDSLEYHADTAFVFTGISEYQPLPEPVEFNAEFADKLVKLSWNVLAQNNIYIAWEIERSGNKSTNFQSITNEAIVPFFEGKGEFNEYCFRFDSLPKNGLEFNYRLRGITSFGERGPWSQVIKGKGIESITSNANINNHFIDKKSVVIRWEFPVEAENSITGFRIYRSERHDVGFIDISGKIRSNKREFSDKKPIETAWYKIMVYRDTIAQKLSYPYMVQQTDSIAPNRPVGLTGIADTSGIVKLSWKINPEKDIFGYRVFRSASGNDEFTQLTITPIPEAFYTDTLSKQDLNQSVFYKIAAVDNRQNQSELSQASEIVKPDNKAPAIPVIAETKPTNTGILLKWFNSSSLDVVKHDIYRQTAFEKTWQKIAEIPVKKDVGTSSYSDTEYPSGMIVRYKIMAVDNNNNQSAPVLSIDIKGLAQESSFELKKLQKKLLPDLGKVVISWEKPAEKVSLYKIYLKNKTGNYEIYQTISGDLASFEIEHVKIGGSYTFRIKAYFQDGSISPFSEELLVEM